MNFLKATCVFCCVLGCSIHAIDGKSYYAIGMLVATSSGMYAKEDALKINQLVLVRCGNDFKVGRIDALHGELYEVTLSMNPYTNSRGGSLFAKKDLYKFPE